MGRVSFPVESPFGIETFQNVSESPDTVILEISM